MQKKAIYSTSSVKEAFRIRRNFAHLTAGLGVSGFCPPHLHPDPPANGRDGQKRKMSNISGQALEKAHE